jgi:Rap1a immunity proteins
MTRALTVICLALVAGLPLSAQAMGSARELADDCRSLLRATIGSGKEIRIPSTKKALVCWGYMQAMQDLSVLADEDGRRVMGACPPERTTLLELIQAFVSYARSHELPDNAALAVTRALQDTFPCKARQGFRWRRYFRLVRRSSIPGKTYAVGGRRLIMPYRASQGIMYRSIALSFRAERSLSNGYPTSTISQRTQLG